MSDTLLERTPQRQPVIHWLLTADSAETAIPQPQTLSDALLSAGSYTNREGQKVYTTDVVVEEQEFAESKNAGGNNGGYSAPQHNNPAPSANTSDLGSADGFMNIPDGIDEELPFN